MSAQSDVLLFDAGNSFLKWALSSGEELRSHGAHRYDRESDDLGISSAVASISVSPANVLAASVAGEHVNQFLADAIQSTWKTDTHFQQVDSRLGGIELAYDKPSTLGVDRWLAMLGARKIQSGPMCIADCGTALTVDGVTSENRHVGGLIAPGYRLMRSALLDETARIHEAEEPVPESMFGTRTGFAVNAGCSYSMAAITDRFMIELAAETGEQATLLVTGGGRERMLPLLVHDALEVPDLVLRGLASINHELR